MIKQELIDKLKEFAKAETPEYKHAEADDLLLEYINDPEITEAFDSIDKWYE